MTDTIILLGYAVVATAVAVVGWHRAYRAGDKTATALHRDLGAVAERVRAIEAKIDGGTVTK